MPLTNAQKQKDSRARRKAKLERLAVLEGALREIYAINPADLQKDDGLAIIHSFLLARDIARKALGDVG